MSNSVGAVIAKLLTPSQVAKATGLKVYSVYALIKEGRLAVINVGRTFRISETELARFVEQESRPRR